MQLLLQNTLFSYKKINDDLVAITGKTEDAASIRISGKIVDDKGLPLAAISVVEKGTTNGVSTKEDGSYTINVKDGNAVLVITGVGYQAAEVAVKDNNYARITLVSVENRLDEVVVIGYGTQKKRDLTGAVISANIKDFEKSPNTNIVQSLQGTVPGLNIGQVTSAGGTPSISIRGRNTISGNTNVLIVLDGIVYENSLSSINPADIESIDVLKDASATAVYGAQAANGVLLITSKKGKAGKARINLSSSYSFQSPTKNYSTMNRGQYLMFLKNLMWNKAYTAASDYTKEDPTFKMTDYLTVKSTMNPDGSIVDTDFDWWGAATRQGSILDNRVSISGGTDAISYLLSYGNTNQKNFLRNDNFKRNSVRANLEAKIRPWWKVGIQASGSFANQDGVEPILWTLYTMNPLVTPYKADGTLNPFPMENAAGNPLMGTGVTDQERHNYLIGNVYSEIQLPVKGLSYRINYGNNYTINNSYQSDPYGNSQTGLAFKDISIYYNYTLDNIVNYNKEVGRHGIGATLVYGARASNYSQTRAESRNFSRLTLGYNSLELGTNQFAYSDANDNSALYQMARINYRYDNKYLLTATVRRDGFSGFAANQKNAIFPSVALAWVISDERFFKIPAVNYLKLRGGYGISGNLTSSYSSLAKVSTGAGYIFGDAGSTVIRQELSSMENPDLKWEKTGGYNIGLDFRLFNDRVKGTIDAYRTKTSDLLYDVSIPTITGFSSIKSNVGNVQNRGIEFTVTTDNIVNHDFEWSTTFNISANRNKVLELTGSGDLITSGLFIGKSLGAIYGYKIDGIYQVKDQIPTGYAIGNYKIHDITGEGEISEADRTILGKTDPAYRFGIMNKFSYKGVSLFFFINSVQGGKDGYLGENYAWLIQDNTARMNNHLNEFTKNIWSPSNPDGIYSASPTAGKIQPIRYEDRSFVRLQDVSLAYDLPKKIVTLIGVQNVNLYVTGKNLLTFTKWHGWDPEANYGTVTPIGRTSTIDKSGNDYEGRPVMRSFTLGINISL
ncbi:TonB-dependent receptor [Filimonas effusa]|uniref:TonB-dependent receptor n=2 Tax=Filimonas effusa TaxID=2508721 RepID=A0A4Q1DEG3_9BACT|nr:TonB-dependent receptor [Filimonas effusa]